LVEDIGRAVQRRTGQLVMVGDLSQPRGGLMSSSHRSHQNGLDVDIWFDLAPSAQAAAERAPEGRDPRSMVSPGGLEVSGAWGPDQRFLLRTAAEDPRVDRIFVNAALKRALCDSERGTRAWLRKVRPWWDHNAHFHVRIRCPQGSPDCEQQTPLPPGDGCGSELDWWFSEEARTPSRKPAERREPPMPKACRALLAGS
jgi:penicillin-insensitive murein endopeptidase